jgi:hypothetical protein
MVDDVVKAIVAESADEFVEVNEAAAWVNWDRKKGGMCAPFF